MKVKTHSQSKRNSSVLPISNIGKISSLKKRNIQLQKKLDRAKKEIAELKKSKNYLNNILDNMPGFVYWKNKAGVILGDNKLHANILGFSSTKEVIGKTDYDLSWKDQAERLRQNDLEVMRKGKSITIEEEGTLPNGKKIIGLTHKAPLRNEKKRVIGIIGISLDITEQKRIEQELQESKIREETQKEIVTTIKTLSGAIAHEMRTPLATLSVTIDQIKFFENRNLPVNHKEKARLLKVCKDTIKNTTHFIDMLLVKIRSMSTIENIKKSFKKCTINLDIEEALNKYPFSEKEKNLISWKDHGLKFEYIGDSQLTKHIIYNLLKNALKVIRESEKGKIIIELEEDKHFNNVIFTDTGCGVPKKILPTIFDVFVTNGSPEGGTGLGLAFCKMTMESYGGNIICESEEGKYTRFILTFPKVKNK